MAEYLLDTTRNHRLKKRGPGRQVKAHQVKQLSGTKFTKSVLQTTAGCHTWSSDDSTGQFPVSIPPRQAALCSLMIF
eukprot:304166-Pelagomonas_calceolata.AAC.1